VSSDKVARMSVDESRCGIASGTALFEISVDGLSAAMNAEEYRRIADIHFRESEKLIARAHSAQAEDRYHEAMLLTDLAIAQRERAAEYEKTAKGEGHDPVVAEILDGLQEQRNSFIQRRRLRMALPDSVPEGRFARALAWIARR